MSLDFWASGSASLSVIWANLAIPIFWEKSWREVASCSSRPTCDTHGRSFFLHDEFVDLRMNEFDRITNIFCDVTGQLLQTNNKET